jgi:hypothetical protein
MPAVYPKSKIWALQGEAAKGGVETSFAKLEGALEIVDCERTLDRLSAVSAFLVQASLELAPALHQGSLQSRRVLRFRVTACIATIELRNTIALGESSEREFKSSLIFDHDRARAKPGLIEPAAYKSEDVTFATLRANRVVR